MSNQVTFNAPEPGPNAPTEIEQAHQQQSTERPEWLPPEFKTVDDFVKSYGETKAAFTRTRQELATLKGEQPPTTEEEPPAEAPAEGDDAERMDRQDKAITEMAAKSGLDLSPYQEEYFSKGDVSEENRAKIAEAFAPQLGPNSRQIVDDFIESRKIIHNNDRNMYFNAAGGQEAYGEMIQWASQTLPPDQIAAYNRTVNGGDRHATLFAIESLRARYEAAQGRAPTARVSGRPNTVGATPFGSTAEMQRAMSDPRYKTDEAYREEVRRRLAVTPDS